MTQDFAQLTQNLGVLKTKKTLDLGMNERFETYMEVLLNSV